jgi:type VI secretion system protein ImpF
MKPQPQIQISVLDRLIDHNPGNTHEPVQNSLLSIGNIKASVRRDLENLLNTRRQIYTPASSYKEVNDSLFVYGLQDFTAHNPRSPSIRQKLRQDIEKTISRFEPRLKNVSVRIEVSDQTEYLIRFRILGLLVVESLSEPVSFDTYFDVNRGEYKIST